MKYFFLCIFSYLLGGTMLGLAIGYIYYNRDVRNEGSGNLGATNVARSFGWTSGVLTLLWDLGKSLAALSLGRRIGAIGVCLSGCFCLIGHCFPCFHRFHGGKGVAVAAIIALFISWKVFAGALLVFVLAVLFSKRVSVGSVCAASLLGILSVVFGQDIPRIILGLFTGCLVIFMHRDNIRRLLKGEEPKFSANRD